MRPDSARNIKNRYSGCASRAALRYDAHMNLRELVDSVPHWYHRYDFGQGVVTPGSNDCRAVLEKLKLPADMGGLRVLDIGARDGFFSFECERRGAKEVLPVDYVPPDQTGFYVAKQVLGSRLNLL